MCIMLVVTGSIVTGFQSCTKKDMPYTEGIAQIDNYGLYKPKTMVWNDTGNNASWSRCWLYTFSYTNTGQLSSIYIKAFDYDTANRVPDTVTYNLNYANSQDVYPSTYVFEGRAANRGLIINDYHYLFSDKQNVYQDSVVSLIHSAFSDTISKHNYVYGLNKVIVTRSDVKDSTVYNYQGNTLQQTYTYNLPSNQLNNYTTYTYQSGIGQWIDPFWYVKPCKYLFSMVSGSSQYLPVSTIQIYPNSPMYNSITSYTYKTDALGRVIEANSNNSRDRSTTRYTY